MGDFMNCGIYTGDGNKIGVISDLTPTIEVSNVELPPSLDMPSLKISMSFRLAEFMDYKTVSLFGLCDFYKQVRTHKKARINKKWAKRYGYRLIQNTEAAENV